MGASNPTYAELDCRQRTLKLEFLVAPLCFLLTVIRPGRKNSFYIWLCKVYLHGDIILGIHLLPGDRYQGWRSRQSGLSLPPLGARPTRSPRRVLVRRESSFPSP